MASLVSIHLNFKTHDINEFPEVYFYSTLLRVASIILIWPSKHSNIKSPFVLHCGAYKL
jgi:hypothetical protein